MSKRGAAAGPVDAAGSSFFVDGGIVTRCIPGTFNAAGAKVKTYATGTRNPFSVIWHSNGKLYAPVNESANGDSPADPAGGAPALTGLPAMNDYFTQVVKGKYYGHPNPARGEYRLNGANPTATHDQDAIEHADAPPEVLF